MSVSALKVPNDECVVADKQKGHLSHDKAMCPQPREGPIVDVDDSGLTALGHAFVLATPGRTRHRVHKPEKGFFHSLDV